MRWRRAPIRYHRRHIVPGRQCWCEPKVVEEEPGNDAAKDLLNRATQEIRQRRLRREAAAAARLEAAVGLTVPATSPRAI